MIETIPESLEAKDEEGHTPLAEAFSYANEEAIKLLIAAGASQTVRDKEGRNILHLLLVDSSNQPRTDVPFITSALSLIDPTLLSELFLEHCSSGPTGTTPFAHWILSYAMIPANSMPKIPAYETELLPLLLKTMPPETLSMLDGSGQRPLHQAVKQFRPELVEMLIKHDPALLHMENAMGQTPCELAQSLYFQYVTTLPPEDLEPANQAANLVPWGQIGKAAGKSKRESTWVVCRDAAAAHATLTRKLVSVSEAREVARRLAEREKKRRLDEEAARAEE